MNPPSNERSGFNLPPPVVEQAVPADGTKEAAKSAQESGAGRPEQTAGLSAPAAPAVPTIPLSDPLMLAPSAQKTAVSKTTQTVVPNVADDGDLIEKEWVNKAKKIVEATRDDPHRQSQEITVFKADYMKKRYDKTIKVSE